MTLARRAPWRSTARYFLRGAAGSPSRAGFSSGGLRRAGSSPAGTSRATGVMNAATVLSCGSDWDVATMDIGIAHLRLPPDSQAPRIRWHACAAPGRAQFDYFHRNDKQPLCRLGACTSILRAANCAPRRGVHRHVTHRATTPSRRPVPPARRSRGTSCCRRRSIAPAALDWAGSIESPEIVLVWTERGGPNVVAPETAGYGSKLVARAVASELSGTVERDWSPEGAIVILRMDPTRLAA